jgi:hypothetical protein
LMSWLCAEISEKLKAANCPFLGPEDASVPADFANNKLNSLITRNLRPGRLFRYNGKLYRDDDTAPESDRRIDEYHSKGVTLNVNYHVHAINAGDVHRFAKEHAKTLSKHIEEHLDLKKEARFIS